MIPTAKARFPISHPPYIKGGWKWESTHTGDARDVRALVSHH